MFNNSLFSKLFLPNLVIVILLFLSIQFFFLPVVKNRYAYWQCRSILSKVISLAQGFHREHADYAQKWLALSAIESITDCRIEIYNPSLEIQTPTPPKDYDIAQYASLLNKDRKLEHFQSLDNTYSLTMLYPSFQKPEGFIRIVLKKGALSEIDGELWFPLVMFFTLAIFLLLPANILLVMRLQKSFRQLKSAATSLSEGNFNVSVNRFYDIEELDELDKSFNDMVRELNRRFSGMAQDNREWTSIIDSIAEGLLVLDSGGLITYQNPSARHLLQLDYVEPRYYWEIIRQTRFHEMVEAALNEKSNLNRELTLNDRIIFFSVSYQSAQKKLIIVCHDITESKRLEEMKKEFVQSVSHELKTPLTAIKGFVEILGNDIQGENSRYIDIISRHTERLIRLVKDLLLLSELENSQLSLQKESLDIVALLKNTQKIFEKTIAEKNLKLELSVDTDFPHLWVDGFRMEQVFINLLDNAIKYTDSGSIQIAFHRTEKGGQIIIQDSGIGIDKKDLPRIFERFYVADKSRARKLGGTGLGLSIVKQIIQLHRGTINLESGLGQGLRVTLTLPIELQQ